MRIYFSGIGGVALGPLSEIALDAGHEVLGSDREAGLITDTLQKKNIVVSFDQSGDFLESAHKQQPIDWLIYTAALPNDHPELVRARRLGIKASKRDELLAHIIREHNLKLIAVAGTHGKTTATGMLVWALQQLGIPVSYSVGSTLSFAPSGAFDPKSDYFVYECDEFDRNFLHFYPEISLITSVDYDHPDTYPTQQSYNEAFWQFLDQSRQSLLWRADFEHLALAQPRRRSTILEESMVEPFALAGLHNRKNATLVMRCLETLVLADHHQVLAALNSFPGTGRRFEKICPQVYSDYGHHPVEIAATLQLARELSDKILLVYQPHQNVRQHQIKQDYTDCMEQATRIIWLPTYLTREDPQLPILAPEKLTTHLTNRQAVSYMEFGEALAQEIRAAIDDGFLVLCMGAGSIDGWVRDHFQA